MTHCLRAEKSCFDQLPLAERAGWNRAVDYYAEILPAPQGSARQQLLTRLELIGVVKKEEPPNGGLLKSRAVFARLPRRHTSSADGGRKMQAIGGGSTTSFRYWRFTRRL